MTVRPSEPITSSRPRDAAASRRALLRAAHALFGQKGFESTTIREIGERAGVDAALIARYFGSKAELYIAAVAAESADDGAPRAFHRLEDIADAMITRVDQRGPGPILQALIRTDTSAEIQAAARAHVARRLVDPLAATMAQQGSDRSEVRAEIAVSAIIGISLARSLGWFKELGPLPKHELLALLSQMIDPDEPH